MAGFMTGWTYWTSNLPYLTGLLYFSAGSALYIFGSPDAAASASPQYFILFSLGTLAFAVWLNFLGLDVAKWLNNAGAHARWMQCLLLMVLGGVIWWQFGSAVPLTADSMLPGFRLQDWIFWGTIAFAWTGPEAASFMGGEIRDPQRTVPRALLTAAPIIAAVYLLSTASVIVAVAPENLNALYGVMEAIRISAERLGLAWLIIASGNPVPNLLPIFYLPTRDVALGAFLAVLLGLIAGLLPAINAMRLRIADALRRTG
jgi:amino acid transporter